MGKNSTACCSVSIGSQSAVAQYLLLLFPSLLLSLLKTWRRRRRRRRRRSSRTFTLKITHTKIEIMSSPIAFGSVLSDAECTYGGQLEDWIIRWFCLSKISWVHSRRRGMLPGDSAAQTEQIKVQETQMRIWLASVCVHVHPKFPAHCCDRIPACDACVSGCHRCHRDGAWTRPKSCPRFMYLHYFVCRYEINMLRSCSMYYSISLLNTQFGPIACACVCAPCISDFDHLAASCICF